MLNNENLDILLQEITRKKISYGLNEVHKILDGSLVEKLYTDYDERYKIIEYKERIIKAFSEDIEVFMMKNKKSYINHINFLYDLIKNDNSVCALKLKNGDIYFMLNEKDVDIENLINNNQNVNQTKIQKIIEITEQNFIKEMSQIYANVKDLKTSVELSNENILNKFNYSCNENFLEANKLYKLKNFTLKNLEMYENNYISSLSEKHKDKLKYLEKRHEFKMASSILERIVPPNDIVNIDNKLCIFSKIYMKDILDKNKKIDINLKLCFLSANLTNKEIENFFEMVRNVDNNQNHNKTLLYIQIYGYLDSEDYKEIYHNEINDLKKYIISYLVEHKNEVKNIAENYDDYSEFIPDIEGLASIQKQILKNNGLDNFEIKETLSIKCNVQEYLFTFQSIEEIINYINLEANTISISMKYDDDNVLSLTFNMEVLNRDELSIQKTKELVSEVINTLIDCNFYNNKLSIEDLIKEKYANKLDKMISAINLSSVINKNNSVSNNKTKDRMKI